MSERSGNLPLDVKLVAKIGLGIAVAACLGLFLVLVPLGAEKGGDYRQIIGAFGLARQTLGRAMLVFGLIMVGVAGIATWLLSLYTSFRIAGPLYRMSRNLEQLIENGPLPLMPLRASDSLQSEWQALKASAEAVNVQHEALLQEAQSVEHAIQEWAASGRRDSLASAITNLKKVEQRVRL